AVSNAAPARTALIFFTLAFYPTADPLLHRRRDQLTLSSWVTTPSGERGGLTVVRPALLWRPLRSFPGPRRRAVPRDPRRLGPTASRSRTGTPPGGGWRPRLPPWRPGSDRWRAWRS